ncbi:hypothetical protein [Microbacterium sp. APC 3901]|uniref:hypothetical protein n=1 Tax=unclassified Microbacterium TaxID=2609290 RepID=UPI0025B5A650|nr:hypothetical protein [Microbacterium sp. APC 3901]MDN3443748.1 hypothetical protein [Microbacterium sp. APC 3901]
MPMSRNPVVKPKLPYRNVRSVGPVTLYLSDIDAIIARLSKDVGEVRILAGTSTATVADDLRDSTERERSGLVLQASNPGVNIFLYPKKCVVETTDSDPFAQAVVEDAVSLLEQHRRSLAPRFFAQLALTAAPLGILAWSFTRMGVENIPQLVILIALSLVALGTAVFVNVVSWRDYKRLGRTKLVLRNRQEAKDRQVSLATTIWVGLGGTIFGGAVSGVATALLSNPK